AASPVFRHRSFFGCLARVDRFGKQLCMVRERDNLLDFRFWAGASGFGSVRAGIRPRYIFQFVGPTGAAESNLDDQVASDSRSRLARAARVGSFHSPAI